MKSLSLSRDISRYYHLLSSYIHVLYHDHDQIKETIFIFEQVYVY